jgi:hypothetical protein
MKTRLRISLFLNLTLLVCLAILLARGRGTASRQQHQAVTESTGEIVSAASPSQTPSGTAKATSFNWSQIESTDYRVYLENLRSIGCPEQTIRDLITVDVDSLYAARREQVKREWSQKDGSTADLRDDHNLESALRDLQNEEVSVLTALLGSQPAPAIATMAAPPPTRALRHNPANARVFMPLVFQNVDPAALKLNPDEVQAIQDLRDQFLAQVGGAGQDPADPGYRQRWLRAQPEADNMLRGLIGGQAFEEFQMRAAANDANNGSAGR